MSSFIEKIYSKNAINRIKTKVVLLGINDKTDPMKFIIDRLLITILAAILSLLISDYAFIVTPLTIILTYMGIEYLVLDYRIIKRSQKLEGEALFFFQILTLSLETGRDLKGSLELTTKNIDSELSSEFKYALSSLDYGKTLDEALEDMKKRIPSDTIRNVILNITHSNVFGSEIVETLYNQVDYLRDKKLFESKAQIAKMPIKISIVSVIFYIPIIMLLILGPAILSYFVK